MRFFRGTQYWRSQVLGFIGAFCLVLAVKGPIVQSHWGATPMYGGLFGRGYSTNGPSLLTLGGVGRWGGYLLLILGVAALWALFNLRFEILKKLTLGIVLVACVVVVVVIKSVDIYNDITPLSLVPVYFHSGDSVALGWAWIALFFAPLLLWVAARSVEEPSQAERDELFRQYQPVIQVNLPMAPSPNSPSTLATPTPPPDVGDCDACGAKNSLRATRCHRCAATLPWEKARMEKKERAAQTSAAVKSQVAAKGAGLSGNVGEFLKVGVANLLIFAVCASAPLLGYFVWRYLDNNGSDYAGAAFFGWIAGGVLIVGGFLVRMLSTMAQVGAM